MLEVFSNGRTHEPSLDALFARLASDPLDPSFEDFGDFSYPCETDATVRRYFGNFYTWSHVFNLRTDEPSLITALDAAIAANKATDAYAQAKRGSAERQRIERERVAQRLAASEARRGPHTMRLESET